MSKARSLVVAGILTAALTIGAVGAGCSDDDDDDNGNGGEPVATEVMDETPADGGETPADGDETPTEEMADETPEDAG